MMWRNEEANRLQSIIDDLCKVVPVGSREGINNALTELYKMRDEKIATTSLAQRFEDAWEDADNAFWGVVASRFPETKHGDFSFDLYNKWKDLGIEVINRWYHWNTMAPDSNE